MPNKKFKLSKKHGVYAAAGAVLVGTLAAAAITSPGLLHNVFDPRDYSFDDARNNGNTAYNTASDVNGDSDKNSNIDANAAADKPNESKKEKNESLSKADSKDEGEEKRSREEQHKAPENAKRDPAYVNKGSSTQQSKGAGLDKGGYSLVNTGIETDAASSIRALGNNIAADSSNMVEMSNKTGVVTSSAESISTPTPTPEQLSPATVEPQQAPKPSQKPVEAEKPSPTRIPSSWSTAVPTQNPSNGGSSGGTNVNHPDDTPVKPAQTPQPTPTSTQTPVPQATAQPTREPMPTAEPDTKPQDAVEENKKNENEIEVSKGGVGITDHYGGGSSMSSGGATKIDFTKFTSDQTKVEYIQISSTIKTINFEKNKVLFPNLKGYVVSPNNKYYQSIDGVLYSKDGKTLYACPAQLESISEYPTELETIYDSAFIGSQMKNISLPSTVKTVNSKAFSQANIESLTFESESLTLGDLAFYNSSENGLAVKKLIFKSKTPPSVTNNNALTFKDPNTGLDTSGMVIEVPDSENDTVLQAYIKAWGETIDGVYGSGMTSYLMNTAKGAGKNYLFENSALYKKLSSIQTPSEAPEETASPDTEPESGRSGLMLLYAAPSAKGEFVPQANTTVIGSGAFEGCSKITVINLPSTVEELESGCFKGLEGLTSIVVSGTVPAKIGEDVWKDIDPKEVSIYVYPDSVDDYVKEWGEAIDKALGEGTAKNIIKGSSSSYVYIDGALYSVEGDKKVLVDAPHTNLDNFKVADGTAEIASGAFGSKYTYSYVLIPSSVVRIDTNAFLTTSIKTLVMTAQNPPELPEGADMSGIKTIYVPSGSLDKYKEAWGGKCDSIEAPAMNYVCEGHAVYGVNEDNTYTLFNLPVVASGTFTMLDTVREVRERALADCVNVEEVNFSILIEKMGKEAFVNNTALKNIDMSRLTELKEIPERVFYSNASMTQMQLPVLIEILGDEFAAENTALEKVNFDKLTKLKSIGNRAFYNDKSLKDVTLSASLNLSHVGESAFENCSSITSARLPLNIEVISSKLFKNASSLSRLSFSSSLKEIGDEALYATALKSLNLSYNNKLEKIGEGAFAENKELTSIVFPEKVTRVSPSLARNDISLTSISLSRNTEEIADEAFAGCESLTEIDLPAAIKRLGAKVFEGCDKLIKIIVRAIEPPELGENSFGNERDGMSVYVPDDSYDDYLAKWNGDLYNKAEKIIKKLSEIEPVNPDVTPEPSISPSTPPIPPTPAVPTISPIIPGVSPNPSTEPEETEIPDTTEAPVATEVPDAEEAPGETEAPDETDFPSETESTENDNEGATEREQQGNKEDLGQTNQSEAQQDESNKEGAVQEPDKSSASASEGSENTDTKTENQTEGNSEAKADNTMKAESSEGKTNSAEDSEKETETKSSASRQSELNNSVSNDTPAKSETPKQKEMPVKKEEEPKSAPPSKEDAFDGADSDI